MAVSRRDALKSLAAVPVFRPVGGFRQSVGGFRQSVGGFRQSGSFRLQAEDPTLTAIAEVVLPAESNRNTAVTAFTRWIENYKEGVDTDHGYGNTRLRKTGPSPAGNYSKQVAALNAAARAAGAASFGAASVEQRRAILEVAIAEAKVERLSARPTGAHIATDLMGHYFHSSEARDLCYRANIGRDACRGLAGSDRPPKGGSRR
jgi:hypothetical protein